MPSLDQLAHLLRSTIEDVERVTSLMNTAMQQAPHPAFELSRDGVIWYLNNAAAEIIGVTPTQAVGTRFTNYVGDSLMTQRRLDSLKPEPIAQSWPDHWRRDHQTFPCRMTAFPLPGTLGSERPRVILWSERGGSRDKTLHTDEATTERSPLFLSDSSHIMGKDLDPLMATLGIKLNRLCEQLGVTTLAWYKWRRSPDEPLGSRTIELHLRLLDAHPDLAKKITHPIDLQEALRTQRGLEITLGDLALLLGIESRTAYAWAHGQPISGPIQALTDTLLYMLIQKPRHTWDEYCEIVNRQAKLEGVPLWEAKSWSAATYKAMLASRSSTGRAKRRRTRRTPTGDLSLSRPLVDEQSVQADETTLIADPSVELSEHIQKHKRSNDYPSEGTEQTLVSEPLSSADDPVDHQEGSKPRSSRKSSFPRNKQ